jgi:hypothetical protein
MLGAGAGLGHGMELKQNAGQSGAGGQWVWPLCWEEDGGSKEESKGTLQRAAGCPDLGPAQLHGPTLASLWEEIATLLKS